MPSNILYMATPLTPDTTSQKKIYGDSGTGSITDAVGDSKGVKASGTSSSTDVFNGSYGVGGTLAAGWADKSFGVSGSLSTIIDENYSINFQLQITNFTNVYGGYVGTGRQYGLGINHSQSTEEGWHFSGPVGTAAGGLGWRGKGGDASITMDFANGDYSIAGAISMRTGFAYGIYSAAGESYVIEYRTNILKKLFGN
jgi:hypothetical protein